MDLLVDQDALSHETSAGSNDVHSQADPFYYEAPGIKALDADQVIHGGCTPAPTCGNGGNGTASASAAVAGGGIVP